MLIREIPKTFYGWLTVDSIPPNVHFLIDDAEDDWEFSTPFDFIFSRILTGSIKDWPRLFRQSFEYVPILSYCHSLDKVDSYCQGTLTQADGSRSRILSTLLRATMVVCLQTQPLSVGQQWLTTLSLPTGVPWTQPTDTTNSSLMQALSTSTSYARSGP